jgi:hypothetical protein
MALGYEGWVTVKSDTPAPTKTVYTLATATSGIYASNRLESQSGYGGWREATESGSNQDRVGFATPRTYDYPLFDGSFNFELNLPLRDFIKENLLEYRQTLWTARYSTRGGDGADGTILEFDHNYWTNINLAASDGTFVTGTTSWVGLNYTEERDETASSTFCANQFNAPTNSNNFQWQDTNPLNPCSSDPSADPPGNTNPIGFFDSAPEVEGVSMDDCLEWSMDFNQDVVKFFKCENTSSGKDPLSDANPPAFVACGPITYTFNFTEMVGLSAGTQLRDDTLTSGGAVGIVIDDLEIITRSDNISGLESLVPIVYSYYGYTFNF